jgi:hypothetical protein
MTPGQSSGEPFHGKYFEKHKMNVITHRHDEREIKTIRKAFDLAIDKMCTLGAHIEDPADLPCGIVDVSFIGEKIIEHEMRELFDAYLSSMANLKVKNLGEIVK